MSPSSTPSPKKRQLPSIPLEAQMKSRDRGILNVKLEPNVYSLTPPFHGFRGAMYSFAISTNVCHHFLKYKYHSMVKLWYTLFQTLKLQSITCCMKTDVPSKIFAILCLNVFIGQRRMRCRKFLQYFV